MDMIRNREASMSINHGSDAAAADAMSHRFESKTNRYLRSLQFGFIKERFLKYQGKATSTRMKFLMIALPVTFGAMFGMVHYL